MKRIAGTSDPNGIVGGESSTLVDMMKSLHTLAKHDRDKNALGRHTLLLASLILLLIALPLMNLAGGWTPRFPILLTLVLISAIFVNSHQPWVFRFTSVVGLLAICGIVATYYIDNAFIRIGTDLLGIFLLSFTTLIMLNSLVRTDHVSEDTVVGGICVYLLIGLCFAMLFLIMTDLQPGCFATGDESITRSASDPSATANRLLYFSFVTLTTLGYGDIRPVGEIAQMLSVIEAMTGQLYLTIFVARLVALFAGRDRATPQS